MGRRNRSKRNRWEGDDDEDGLERAEMEWLTNRQNSASKRPRPSEGNEALSPSTSKSEASRHEHRSSSPAHKDVPNDDADSKGNQGPQKANNSSKEDSIERKRLKKQRQKKKLKQKKANAALAAEATKQSDSSSPAEKDVPKDNDDAGPHKSICPKKANDSSEEDKIERQKLKKQRQKERRKQKKAEAASAAEARKQSRQESEKAFQNKQKQENDKKRRMKEKRPQQQFTTLAKGVQYQDLVVGNGPPVQHRKKVRVSYTLRSKSHASGKILDSSANFGFRLGKGEVIRGWDIGLQGMRAGGVRRLVVPPEAGYGHHKDVGAGRGADLYFQIDLLNVAP